MENTETREEGPSAVTQEKAAECPIRPVKSHKRQPSVAMSAIKLATVYVTMTYLATHSVIVTAIAASLAAIAVAALGCRRR
jgi:hypothetical protein